LKKIFVPMEPQISATVLTIQTSFQPANKSNTHMVAIANGRARSGDQADRWRLFDLEHGSVIFVDDIEKTYYAQPIRRIVTARRPILSGDIPEGAQPAEFSSTGAKRDILGIEAVQSVIKLGEYQRELWMGVSPNVPANLFAALYATQPLDPRYAPVMRQVEDAVLKLQGFPLIDHSELPVGDAKMIVDRTVLKIEQRNVAESWLKVPDDYREITAPGERRPPASSPPPSRSIQVME
jgi:hypothetical protein